MLDLKVHLRQRVLHLLDLLRGHLYQLLAMPHDGADRSDRIFGPESGAQPNRPNVGTESIDIHAYPFCARSIRPVPGIDHAGL